MEDIFRLCDLEPQHCQEVFMALDYSTAAEKSKMNSNLTTDLQVWAKHKVLVDMNQTIKNQFVVETIQFSRFIQLCEEASEVSRPAAWLQRAARG